MFRLPTLHTPASNRASVGKLLHSLSESMTLGQTKAESAHTTKVASSMKLIARTDRRWFGERVSPPSDPLSFPWEVNAEIPKSASEIGEVVCRPALNRASHRSETEWHSSHSTLERLTVFCNSPQLSQFAAVFIEARTKGSPVECFFAQRVWCFGFNFWGESGEDN